MITLHSHKSLKVFQVCCVFSAMGWHNHLLDLSSVNSEPYQLQRYSTDKAINLIQASSAFRTKNSMFISCLPGLGTGCTLMFSGLQFFNVSKLALKNPNYLWLILSGSSTTQFAAQVLTCIDVNGSQFTATHRISLGAMWIGKRAAQSYQNCIVSYISPQLMTKSILNKASRFWTGCPSQQKESYVILVWAFCSQCNLSCH